MDHYLLDVQVGLGAAILRQHRGLRLPPLPALAEHYGLHPATLAVLRRNLVGIGRLDLQGPDYITTHPRTYRPARPRNATSGDARA